MRDKIFVGGTPLNKISLASKSCIPPLLGVLRAVNGNPYFLNCSFKYCANLCSFAEPLRLLLRPNLLLHSGHSEDFFSSSHGLLHILQFLIMVAVRAQYLFLSCHHPMLSLKLATT